jgi:zinc transport system substrate-binding protein
VQQIGKERVTVGVMVQPGANPATYEPKPSQMAALATTAIYFAIGVPFERSWLENIAAANPRLRVVHTDGGIEKRPMAARLFGHGAGDAPRPDPGGHETHPRSPAGLDPHIWLSPPLVKIQARTIRAALQETDPAHAGRYEANYREFIARLDQLDADLKRSFAGKTGLPFMVFHPSWGYFAQAYGLRQVPIEMEGKNPKPAQLQALIRQARTSGIKVIFVQPQFSAKSAQLVAREIGGRVVVADPLAEDWMANLRAVAATFRSALR